MWKYTCLLLVFTGWVLFPFAVAQEELVTSNGLVRGLWGNPEQCSQGHTFAIDFKYEQPGQLDDTAGNSVQMLCHLGDGQLVDSITSFEGKYGDWQGIRTCPNKTNIVGFRARVLQEQGTFGDDHGVDNVQVRCADGTVLDGMDGVIPAVKGQDNVQEDDDNVISKWIDINGQRVQVLQIRSSHKGSKINGEWSNWATCSSGSVAAIRTRVEEGDPLQDDAGLCDISMYCYA
ncbi:hypothetical protein SK128_005176 [Halocaridina rubra]|uniref:Vitelline membrane outer layer protein 1 n=1 Tax=Halocaridina rubra TaxID=373956 RepID=A0AAN8WVX3_HALRR